MLGARTLVPTDEGRYAEMAREMVATGDWVTPRLNGIKYFEKPPLQTWMNALTFQAFGLGEWQARLWTGLSGLFGIFLVGYTGTRLVNQRAGITAAIVLASSFWWAGMGHINTLDMGLSGMMTLALCGLLLAQRDQATKTERRNWMLACWVGVALATMSKGLMGLALPGSILFLYTFVARDWRIWQRLHLVKGLLLFFAITVPWFILAAQANDEFLQFFFIHEHWERYTTKVHSRAGPWYYFIPLMIAGIFPWLGLLIQSLREGANQQASTFQPNKLLLTWCVFIFIFFSISNSKLPSYILPIFPGLALLIAMHLEHKAHRGLMVTSGLMSLLGLCGLAAWGFFSLTHSEYGGGSSRDAAEYALQNALNAAYLPYVLVSSLIMLVVGILAWNAARPAKNQQYRAVWMLAWAGLTSGQLLFLGHDSWGRHLAGVDHVPAIQAELKPDTIIYSVGRYEQSLPFYLRHTLVLVEHPDELAFGLQQEPQLWIPKRADFVKQWLVHQANGVTALAILNPDIYDEFVRQGIPMRVISEDPRRVIVSSKVN